MFWDQRLNKVYSDSFIHIERADRTIEGYGFESNDKMTNYRITNPTGIFPASDFNPGKESGAADAPSAGSVAEAKGPDRLPPPNRPSKPVLPSRPPGRRP